MALSTLRPQKRARRTSGNGIMPLPQQVNPMQTMMMNPMMAMAMNQMMGQAMPNSMSAMGLPGPQQMMPTFGVADGQSEGGSESEEERALPGSSSAGSSVAQQERAGPGPLVAEGVGVPSAGQPANVRSASAAASDQGGAPASPLRAGVGNGDAIQDEFNARRNAEQYISRSVTYVKNMPRQYLALCMEFLDPRMDMTYTSECSTNGLLALLWLYCRVKPYVKVLADLSHLDYLKSFL